MVIKELFEKAENGTLTFEQFESLMKESGANFKDMSTGEYVSKHKYDDALEAKDKEIETLNKTIGTRDTDLEELKTKLSEAGTDAEKLNTLTDDFTKLQGKYDADVKAYKEQLKKQAYEFAVKEYANTLNFSSAAAKRDFTQSLIKENYKMDNGKIMGAEDFRVKYESENTDAFKAVEPTPAPQPTPEPTPKPAFVNPTPGTPNPAHVSLSQMMQAKNENPDMTVTF